LGLRSTDSAEAAGAAVLDLAALAAGVMETVLALAGAAWVGVVGVGVDGAGVGRGSALGSGTPSGIALGGAVDRHTDMATMGIPAATYMATRHLRTLLRTTIRIRLRSRTTSTSRTIQAPRTAIGLHQMDRALRLRKIPATWPCRFSFT